MNTNIRRPFGLVLNLVILISFILFQFVGAAQAQPGLRPGDLNAEALTKISPELQARMSNLAADESIDVIIRMRERANIRNINDRQRRVRLRRIINALKNTANRSQRGVGQLLSQRRAQGRVVRYQSYWVFNGFAATVKADVIDELARRPDVASVTPDESFEAPTLSEASASAEPNLNLVNAPALWDLGLQGNGMVVANLDTGVYLNHPDLMARWRGGTNSWFDPNGQHPNEPFDINGHGTWTMGVMAGGDAGGTSVGIAPQAQWIAVKIFNDQGNATTSGIHSAYQWILDPDGDPNSDDAPHILNNSWTFSAPGCSLEFEPDLEALRTAGILPVFAAGNSGPNPGANVSPANNPSAFAVGATDNADQIYVGSGRGPSNCGEPESVFPEMVAPGVDIRSTDLYGLYASHTGTSLAAPHVAAGLALLLSAFPDLTASEQEAALLNGLVDLGPAGPDPEFGYGRLDLLASYQWLASNQTPPTDTPLPADTPTETPTDIATDTPTETPTDVATATPTETPLPTFTFTPSNTPTPSATFTVTATNSPTFTATFTPTSTPTNTPSPTQPSSPPSALLYMSFTANGSYPVGAVNGVRDEDILSFDGSDFAMVFDGSDVGVGGLDVDAFHFIDGDTLLLSFNNAATIGSLGTVDDSDIVRFDAATLGTTTGGTFSLFFDGSSAGLTTNNEDVDAIDLMPDGSLVISALGGISVPGLSGTWQDEDLLAFTPSSSGDYTSGTWSVYFDGSDVGLSTSASEDVDGVEIDANGDIYLTTLGDFSVTGISGADEDIFVCLSPVTGVATACSFSSVLSFDGSLFGLDANGVDAFAMP